MGREEDGERYLEMLASDLRLAGAKPAGICTPASVG